jgi:predicted O-methyltransferase YrrM
MKTIDDINDFNYFAGNLRETNFKIIEDYIKNNNVKNILETGTIRGHPTEFSYIAGDGLSTLIFTHFAKKYNFNFYSIDISVYNIEQSKQVLKQFNLQDYVKYINSDSAKFLSEFNEEIDILYLDSYDFKENEEINSQNHQLKEIIAAHDKLKKNSLVFLDDCGQRDDGKCKLSSEFLLKNNYNLIVQNYQNIFKKV